MKIALVLLPAWSTMTAPLGLAAIAATLKEAGHEVKSFDFNVRLWNKFKHLGNDPWNYGNSTTWQHESSFNEKIYPIIGPALEEMMAEVAAWGPEVVGFSIYLTGINATRKGAAAIKRMLPNVKVVYGGPEINRVRLEYHRELEKSVVDVAVMAEGEQTILELLRRFENGESLAGCLGIAYRGPEGETVYEGVRPNMRLEDLPLPDFSDFDLSLYANRSLPVMMSRGCIAKCTFCAETRFWNNFRYRSAQSIFNEFMNNVRLYGVLHFEMADSLINGNFKVLSELADLLIAADQKIAWGGYARVDKRMTFNLLGRLAKSGLNFLNFGLETGSQKVMDLMEKRTTVEAAREVVTNAGRFGIMVALNIIVGFPGETEEDFQETLSFIREYKDSIFVVSTGDTLWVTHGTPLNDSPSLFGIKARPDGKAFLDEWGNWISADGSNTIELRRERLVRLQKFLDEEKIYWQPSGNNKKNGPGPVDIDALLAEEAIHQSSPAPAAAMA